MLAIRKSITSSPRHFAAQAVAAPRRYSLLDGFDAVFDIEGQASRERIADLARTRTRASAEAAWGAVGKYLTFAVESVAAARDTDRAK